jgi:hypothetical protein
MQHRIWVKTWTESSIYEAWVRIIALIILGLSVGTLGRTQTLTPPKSQQEHSRSIHEILQEAKSYQAADATTRTALRKVLGRQTKTFAEFERQCADLQATLTENDVMEKRKRKMLAELRLAFRDDPEVQPTFGVLYQMEDVSDRADPIWRGMIACSGILASLDQSKQEAYQTICVDPAYRQLSLLIPEINRLGNQLQTELQKHGSSLPPEFLQAIEQ